MPDNRPTPDHVVRFEPSPALKCDPASLIAEAEALHASLAETKASAARLIAGLRRHRKQSRLVSETLKSLRQLKLAEAVD